MANERTQRLVRVGAVLFTLTLTAMLSAQGATQLVAAAVLPVTAESANKVPPLRVTAREERVLTPRELGEAVLKRNIFDSQTGAIEWLAPPPPAPEPEVSVAGVGPDGEIGGVLDPEGEPAFCPPGTRLVAAMVDTRHPERSFATIETGGKPMMFRPKMDVSGAELVGVREHRVFLRPKGQPLCQLAMFVPPQPIVPVAVPPPVAAPAEERPPAHKSSISEDELNAGITAVSETQYNVSRQLLDKVLGNQAELMRAARVIPFEENGRTVGVKVYGIRRNALLGKLGIQNGDVLRTINGFDLSSPDSALEAYTKLRETDAFSIAMVRRGAPKTMEYSVK